MDPVRDELSDPAVETLCTILRGEHRRMSAAVLDAARRHRIHLVLADVVGDRVQDDQVRAALVADVREAAVADLVREQTLRRLLTLLAEAGVHALLLKGAGLAYRTYRSPYLRPRGDVDILIERAALDVVDRALVGDGWLRAVEQTRESVTTQRHYQLVTGGAIREQLDVHWKIAVPHLFGDALGFEELAVRSVQIAALGSNARTLSDPDALFLACVHRVAHHQDAVDLLWLWDVHLLASRLSEAERTRFVQLAVARSMRAVCARGIELAFACFATPGAADLMAAVGPGATERPEPSVRFLGGGLRQVDLLRGDLSMLEGWRARLALLGGHLFPSAAYMRSRYPRWPTVTLPLAYVHRIVRGAPKWFRRGPQNS